MPSQSLSTPGRAPQSRGPAETAPTHEPSRPPVHVAVPNAQTPTSVAGPQAYVLPSMHVHSSLGRPLQLASSPSTVQLSAAAGPTEPSQGPQLLERLSAAATQVRSPAWHGPLPSRSGCASHASVVPGSHTQAP